MFKNSFISFAYKDQEGSILLGTFGKGIIVIPNLDLVNISMPDDNTNLIKLTSTDYNSIIIGSQDGSVYQMDSTQKVKLILKDNNNIEVLEYLNNLDDVLVIGQFIYTIDNNSKKRKKILYGAVKDVESIDGNNYIIALNHGVTFFTYDKNDTKFKNYSTENFNGRSYCTNYDTVNNIIYAGTYKGLKIGNESNVDYFTLDSQSLICNDILVAGIIKRT